MIPQETSLKLPVEANFEEKFENSHVIALLRFLELNTETLNLTDDQFFAQLPVIIQAIKTNEFRSIHQNPNVDIKVWHRFNQEVDKNYPSFSDDKLGSFSDQEKELYYIENIPIELRPTAMKIGVQLIVGRGKLNAKIIERAYKFAKKFQLPKRVTSHILTSISAHNEKVLLMIKSMPAKTRIMSYLYVVKVFLETGHHLDTEEAKALVTLRNQYGLDFTDHQFWQEYLSVLEGSKSGLKFKDCDSELDRIVAALAILIFEDGDINKAEAQEMKEVLDRFDMDSKTFKEVKNRYIGVEFDEIIKPLSDRALLYLLVQSLYVACADGKINKGESAIFQKIAKIMKGKNIKIEDADSLYLFFLQFLFENPNFCQLKEGRDAKAIDKFLRESISLKVPLLTAVYFIESFLNTKGIVHTKETFKMILSCIGMEKDTIPEAMEVCFDEETKATDKHQMLLAIMKVQYLIEFGASKEMIDSAKFILENIPKPTQDEANAVSYHMLRAILLDEEISKQELDIFEEVAFQIKVNQSVVHQYTNYLFLETAMKYNFRGWIDYEEFRKEKTKNRTTLDAWGVA